MILKASPKLVESEIKKYFDIAQNSERRRSPKILHKKGDFLNKVFNFMLSDSYMQPHLHPSEEKIENMYLLHGSFALIIFDDSGEITKSVVLAKEKKEFIAVPAFTWHTYIMLTDEVIVYEEMDGIYDPSSWKKMATWAPVEGSSQASLYLEKLKASLES
jgi:cupin fold WbuC family metalloprotein